MSAPYGPMDQGEYIVPATGVNYDNLLGQIRTAADADNIGGSEVKNTPGERTLMFVKNGSGSTIAAGQSLKFVAAQFRKQVTLATAGGAIRGFSPYSINGSIANTIPNNAYFWMIIDGPRYALTDGASIAEGAIVTVGSSSGTVKTDVTAPAANTSVRGGTAMAAAAAKGTSPNNVYVRLNGRCDV